jgi:hypothetical protein
MLEIKMNEAVALERSSTLRVLKLIVEAEATRFHLERGYSSLHDWLITAYRYSEGAANRRVKAARLLRLVGEEKFLDGTFSLSTLALAEAYTRKLPEERKREILVELAGKSGREAEKILAKHFPEKLEQETVKPLREGISRLSVNVPDETIEKLKALRDEMSHRLLTIGETIAALVAEKRCVTRKCTYQDPQTKKICGGTFLVEEDHIIPRGKGGSDQPENLRDLCRAHNILVAEQAYGRDFMARWKN